MSISIRSTRRPDVLVPCPKTILSYPRPIVIISFISSRLYLNAGDVLTHLDRHEAALENYRRALALFPMSPASRGKVALLEVEMGNVERGTFMVESIVKRWVRELGSP
jgi:tetratricopeptide (TPR) repeat protein